MRERKNIYTLLHQDAGLAARTGVIRLPHGTVQTPAFMPVGTAATVKGITKDDLHEIGFEIILANTYHLFLRPGMDVIKQAGGLHGFSGWNKNFLTDSGGFQVFSLSQLRKIKEEGVTFQSHIDGSRQFLSPEIAVQVQAAFNSDIQMQLDICSPYGIPKKETEKALTLTTAWMHRAVREWDQTEGYEGSLFPIIQGGFFEDLRIRSIESIMECDPHGIAIGGLSVGEPEEVYKEFLAFTAAHVPKHKPLYVMGIGTPDYILEAVKNGVDIFDCVLPSRNARNGNLFTRTGPISIKKKEYEYDFGPIDPSCSCKVCRNYSRAYLRHLFRCKEILYSMLATYHNLAFLHRMVAEIRDAITADRFSEYYRSFLKDYYGRA
ncbi:MULTISPECIES: tRNA guanosine(34) transglycosylase Tgt [unclassified Treponema]|uniref:tRNA guanosine(34) transglycosylase Tgt n=1 Tax=unclassified Treponema TaxID=2638727 RepID=UPI0005300D88|nr:MULTISPECIES: tRNA guanosine(34) transglycosylase Tgt [unclassified Treponema]AIW88425.1 queuine tRNA-ribosyltransferase [Treponema sp. OMZ 838]UTC51561.1 tRNA guanosine(34) transglycosylase Tgt [Treponema sp. OMZ 855]